MVFAKTESVCVRKVTMAMTANSVVVRMIATRMEFVMHTQARADATPTGLEMIVLLGGVLWTVSQTRPRPQEANVCEACVSVTKDLLVCHAIQERV